MQIKVDVRGVQIKVDALSEDRGSSVGLRVLGKESSVLTETVKHFLWEPEPRLYVL